MEINLKREAFSSTLQNINSVVDKSTSSNKPILSNFVIRTMEGEVSKVEFSSTDYELSLVEQVEAEITEPGSICVNAKKVFDIVKELQGEDVKIRSTEQLWIHITCGSSEMRLPSVEVGLYPQTVLEDLPQSMTISVDDLKQCIDMTLFAAIAAAGGLLPPLDKRYTIWGSAIYKKICNSFGRIFSQYSSRIN